MRDRTLLSCDVLNWLARLPFLAADDLALLTGSPPEDVESTLRGMGRDGQVDWVTPSSPELDGSRLHVLTEPARQHVARDSDWIHEGVSALPIVKRDVLHRLTCLEATVALNVFAADLRSALRRSAEVDLGDFWSLPVGRPRDAWWPPGVHGFGFLQSGGSAAPFFVFIDRAGAPAAHRAALVSSWYHFRDGGQSWGRDSVPPILLLCPGSAQVGEWTNADFASSERRGVTALHLAFADCSMPECPASASIWRRSGGNFRTSLAQQLTWLPSAEHPAGPSTLDGQLPLAEGSAPRLHALGQAVCRRERSASGLERIAALSLTTASTVKQLLDCLGHHPLLTEADLAVALRIPERVARRAVERALADGLIVEVGGGGGRRRYCLTMSALRLLAARDGVPIRRYAQHAPVTAMPGEGKGHLPTLLRQREHTVGANSFFLGLLHSETPATPKLVSWLNAAESAVRFESAGVRHSLRADGSGQVLAEGHVATFLLEWDRGTERPPVLGAKLARYAAYFRSATVGGGTAPALLFVTTTPQREDLVRRLTALTLAQFDSLVLTTCVPLLERLGPRAPIWRTSSNEPRTTWPTPSSGGTPKEVRQ
ncbi:MAG: replication-relaxation family protein [Dehalococcoidia bacterium]|nr:replication-relaxation family protein [Thermoflexaceae bacterium]